MLPGHLVKQVFENEILKFFLISKMASASQINIENSKSDSTEVSYYEDVCDESSNYRLDLVKLWVKKQRFIPQKLSSNFLQQFLNHCQGDAEKTENMLKKYFYLRQENPRLFRDRDPASRINSEIFRNLYVLPIPGVTSDSKKIIVTGLIDGNHLNYHPFYHMKAIALVLDLLLWNNELADYIIVLDGKSFKSPYSLINVGGEIEKDAKEFQENFPYSMIGYYVLYPPDYVENVMEMREGIWMNIFHNRQELREKLPPDLLPLEFGGNLGHLNDLLQQWNVRLSSNRNFFIEFEAKMSNDYRRRLCHLKETEDGPFWVHKLKLVEDEYRYKTEYYQKLKSIKSTKLSKSRHEFSLRPPFFDPLKEIRKMAKEEKEKAEIFDPPKLYNGYAKGIRKAREEFEKKGKVSNPKIPCVAILFSS